MAKQKTLQDLFHDTLKDIYFAEKKILTALPKMAKAAQSSELQAAFQKHEAETEQHGEEMPGFRLDEELHRRERQLVGRRVPGDGIRAEAVHVHEQHEEERAASDRVDGEEAPVRGQRSDRLAAQGVASRSTAQASKSSVRTGSPGVASWMHVATR